MVTTSFWGIISLTTLMLYRRSFFQDKYVLTCLPLVCRTRRFTKRLCISDFVLHDWGVCRHLRCVSHVRGCIYIQSILPVSLSLLLSEVPQYRIALHTGTEQIFLDHKLFSFPQCFKIIPDSMKFLQSSVTQSETGFLPLQL